MELFVSSRRHHVRIWKTDYTLNGAPLWIGAATHDVAIEIAKRGRLIGHRIDPDVVTEIKPVVRPRFRILVVDDELAIRETAGMILKREGYDVRTAADGVDGLSALSAYLPDLIISDLNMPHVGL